MIAGTAVAGALSGVAILLAVDAAGPLVLIVPAGAVAASYLWSRPKVAVGLFLAAVVLVESDEDGVLGVGARAYEGVTASVNAKPLDLCLLALLPLVLFSSIRARRRIAVTGPWILALVVMTLAVIAGVATGFSHGSGPSEMINPLRQLAYLVAVPVLVVCVLHTQADIRWMANAGLALTVIKGSAGVGVSLLGAGPAIQDFAPGSLSLSYYEPGSPWLLLLALMTITAAALVGVRLGRWGRVGGAVSLGALLLSFRRSFWLGAIVGFVTLMIATSGERPRWRSGVVIAVAVGAIAALSLSFGAVPSSDNVVLRRAQELAALTSSDKSIGDQYRVNERQNALENVRRHPVTGLGLGVPWREYHRLPTVFEDGRNYVHIAALWYWLKLGVLGVIAYALFMFAAVHAGWRVWKRQRDPRLRAVGLGAAAAVTGLMVAEATASFTGVEARVSVIFGAMLGWLIAAGAVDEAAHAPLRTPSD